MVAVVRRIFVLSATGYFKIFEDGRLSPSFMAINSGRSMGAVLNIPGIFEVNTKK